MQDVSKKSIYASLSERNLQECPFAGDVQKKQGRFSRASVIFLFLGTVFLLASVFLIVLAKNGGDWLLNSYLPFSRYISGTLSDVFSIFPFSFAELIVYMILVCILVFLFAGIVKLAARTLNLRHVISFVSVLYMAASCIVCMFLLFWGLNYYAPSIESQLKLNPVPASRDALIETTLWLKDRLNEYAPLVPRNSGGACDFGELSEIAEYAGRGFEALSAKEPRFSGTYNIPKRIFSWRLFSRLGIWGIYIPLTGETNVNPDVPDASAPFTICHETSHRLAVAPEQEANFSAFLACINNDSPMYEYSGYFSAFIYCANAVTRLYPEETDNIYKELDPGVIADFQILSEHNRKNEGAVREFAADVNDNYLRSMSQDDGILSYGRVADLIVYYYMSAKET